MPAVPHVVGRMGSLGAGASYFCPIGHTAQGATGGSEWNQSESRSDIGIRTTATMSRLAIPGSSQNSLSVAAILVSRLSGVGDGNCIITITASSTAAFEDTSNTDSLDATELWHFRWYAGAGTGVGYPGCSSALIEPASGTLNIFSHSGMMITGTSDLYTGLVARQEDYTTNSWEYEARVPFATTFKNAWGRIDSNSRSDSVSLRFATDPDGSGQVARNQILTWTAAQTADKEDTSNTDSVTAGHYACWMVDVAGGTGTALLRAAKVEQTHTDKFMFTATWGAGALSSSTSYHVVTGDLVPETTSEILARARMNVAFTWSNLFGHCTYTTGTITMRSRVNGANGNQLCTFTTNEMIVDTSNSDSVAVDDAISISMVDTGSGTMKTVTSQGLLGSTAVSIPVDRGLLTFTGRAPLARVDYPAKIRIKSVAA